MTRKAWRDTDIAAYLDGELSPEQRAVFETRLTQNVTLRQQVALQRGTIDFVRDVPQRIPPRNYLLTPAMVASPATAPRPRQSKTLLMMRLATSLAALFFIVSVGLNMMPFAQRNRFMMPAQKSVVDDSAGIVAPASDNSMPMAMPQETAVAEIEMTMDESVPVSLEGAEGETVLVAGAFQENADVPPEKEVAKLGLIPSDSETFSDSPLTSTLPSLPTAPDMMLDELHADDGAITTSATLPGAVAVGDMSQPDVHDPPAPAHNFSYVVWVTGVFTLILAALTIWVSRRSE